MRIVNREELITILWQSVLYVALIATLTYFASGGVLFNG